MGQDCDGAIVVVGLTIPIIVAEKGELVRRMLAG